MDMSRRQMLSMAAVGGGLVFGGGLLSGCGASASAGSNVSTRVRAAGGAPRRGGIMVHGTSGGSTADSLTAWNVASGADYSRWRAQYETLWTADAKYNIVPKLLEDYTVNKKGDLWKIKLRPGLHFSDGRPATMKDMLWSIRTQLDPKTGSALGLNAAGIDLANSHAIDDLTLVLKLKSPLVNLPEIMTNAPLVPIGYTVSKPVGTGPYRIKQFTPGTLTQFERNPHYWQDGKPYCDELHIVEFQDESSRINALLDGQILVADTIDFTLVNLLSGQPGVNVLVQPGNSWVPLQMRCDQPPFDDVRVRQAFRLLVDRGAMNEGAFRGYATLAKDLYSHQDPIYDTALPQREQDIDQAKFLLKKAGAENLSVTLTTGDLGSGVLALSQLFAAQAARAGVKVKLNQVDSATFYGPNYGTYSFSPIVSAPMDYLATVQNFDGPTSQQNFTYFKDAKFSSLYYQAIAEFDESRRKELAWEMQKIQYDTGGLIITGFYDALDGYSDRVQGLVPNVSGLTIYNYEDLWLTH